MRDQRMTEYWMSAAHRAAPLGEQAIKDMVREVSIGQHVVIQDITCKPKDRRWEVTVTHRLPPFDGKEQPIQLTIFTVDNPGICMPTWEGNLEWMRDWQAHTPAHLRGLDINVSEEEYRQVMQLISDKTGYHVGMGDIWVHKVTGKEIIPLGPFSKPPHIARPPGDVGSLCFGYLTDAGSIAVHKYMKESGIEREQPVRHGSAEGDAGRGGEASPQQHDSATTG